MQNQSCYSLNNVNQATNNLPIENKVEVSVVMPYLNEAQTVGACVQKALRAMKVFGISGEVVIADND